MKKQRITLAALAAFSLVLAACSSTGASNDTTSSSQSVETSSSSVASSSETQGSTDSGTSSAATGFTGDPLKIGFLDTMTGANGNVGQLNLQGAQIAVDQWNAQGGVLGRKIELVVKDEELSPEKTVQHMREFASDKINLITGFTSSSDVLAAKPLAEQNNQLIVTAGATDTSLTTTQHSKNVYEVAANVHMMNVAAAHLAGTDWKDAKVWDGVAYDYLTGHDAWDEFGTLLKTENPSAKTGKSAFVPFTATQNTPFINSLLAGNPSPASSALYYFMYGGGAVQFAKQALPLDLFSQYKYVVGFAGGEEFSSALGAEGPHTYFIHDYFYQAYDNPVNQAFIDAWKKLPPTQGLKLAGPHEWTEEGYTAMLAYLNAIKTAGSTDTDAVRSALSTISFESPMGTVKFDPSNILAAPVTMWQCKGDASAEIGYSCFGSESVGPEVTLAK
ncbi:MAG: ABC transporter substrate-binding protein [Nakamurella sp.]